MSSRTGPLAQRIAAEIRAELGRQNRSRRWLADQIEQNHVTVSRWVNGESPLSFDALDTICETLGVTIADLLAASDRHGQPLPPAGRAQTGGRAVSTPRVTRADTKEGTGRDTRQCVPLGAQLAAA